MESKDEWDAKEGTGKSTKNALHVQQYGKRHFLMSNSEKIKHVALAIVELHEIRQAGWPAGRQAVSQ